MGKRLEGKVAIVVGAGSTRGETMGNGRATAILFAREGASVLLVDRDRETTEETERMIEAEKGISSVCVADVTHVEECERLAQRCVATYGRIEELTILAAAASVLPTDARSGAREIGVVDYIQSLLSFMPGVDANCDERVNAADIAAVARKATGYADECPNGDVDGDASIDDADVIAAAAATFRARPVFGGGPFSGRNPQPHFAIGSTPCQTCHGTTAVGESEPVPRGGSADVYPPNAFELFLPLNRLQRLSWRIRLLGGQSVHEVADNPLARESLEVDLRSRYRRGLAAVEDKSQRTLGTAFVALPPAQQMEILSTADAVFYQVLQRHVIDGTLCAPEYGGNRDRLGWQLAGFDGDSQPLGYTIYDPAVPGHYRERPDKPNFGPNPDERCAPFSEGQSRFLDLLTQIAQPGGHFTSPYCFEVEE